VSEHLGAFAVHREDHAAVPEAEQVVKGHRAELARMARHAGDDHAARVEERTEALEHRRGIERRPHRGRGRRRGRRVDLHERVDGDGQPVAHDQRVQVDAADVGALLAEASETDEEPRQGVAIDRRLAAEAAEQRLRAQAVYQPQRLAGAGAPPRRRRRRAPR
jgi:hypothetical protein